MSKITPRGSRPAGEPLALEPQGPQRPDADTTPAQLVLALRTEQREQWLGGRRIPVESFLARHPHLQVDRDQVLDLIYGEFMLREQLGEEPVLEEYQQRFPQFAEALRRQIDFHRALEADEPSDSSNELTFRAWGRTALREEPRGGGWPHVPGYEITEELGRGGMGVVYLARQLGLNRLVALKMIRSGAHADTDLLARFRLEAEAVARLHHPNIVQIHEIGEQDGCPYFSLEYVEGGALAERLDSRPQSPPWAAALVETLARAIHHAHTQGIIHRDLKPANILLDCELRIADCGVEDRKSAIRNSKDHRLRPGQAIPTRNGPDGDRNGAGDAELHGP